MNQNTEIRANSKNPARLDRMKACMLGGAAGDALGYPVEFLSESALHAQYGPAGITRPKLQNRQFEISDDTQMTLFTAWGLLISPEDVQKEKFNEVLTNIWLAYQDWYITQTTSFSAWKSKGKTGATGHLDLPELFSCRAPGLTCLSALKSSQNGGSIAHPLNNSKGCGGVMRVSPIALALAGHWPQKQVDLLGAEAAALSHGHPLGWLSAGALVHLLSEILTEGGSLKEAVEKTIIELPESFETGKDLDLMISLLEKCLELADAECTDLEAVHALGQGWVGEEALAIGLVCALRHPDDFSAGIMAAVNHQGDSDSTGQICGTILGAYLGEIPALWTKNLELKEQLIEAAVRMDDLFKNRF